MSFEEAAAVCDGAAQALASLRKADARPGRGSSSTARPARSGPRPSSSPSTSARTSPASAAPSTSSSSARWAPTRSSTTAPRTSRSAARPYDAIIDAVGKYSFRRGRRALKPGGIYVGDGRHRDALLVVVDPARRQQAGPDRGGRAEQGGRPVPEGAHRGRRVPRRDRSALPDGEVVEAHRYVETWHKAGNVVLTIP